jgi:hypothetical protein
MNVQFLFLCDKLSRSKYILTNHCVWRVPFFGVGQCQVQNIPNKFKEEKKVIKCKWKKDEEKEAIKTKEQRKGIRASYEFGIKDMKQEKLDTQKRETQE